MVLLLNSAEVERLLDIEQCLAVLEQAYKDLSAGRAINRPRSHTFTPTTNSGTFQTIEGGSGGLGVFALRINSELWRAPTAASPRVKKLPAVADGRYTEFILLFSDHYRREPDLGPSSHKSASLERHRDVVCREPPGSCQATPVFPS